METINLGIDDDLPPVDWTAIVGTLEARTGPDPDAHNAYSTWLTTLDPDGAPHVTPVGAIWVDGTFWFQTGRTRKARNLARDPRCTLAVSIRGADVVIDGTAERVTGEAELRRATDRWAGHGWPVEPDPSGTGITAPFNAPAQGPPPWTVFRLAPRSALVCLGDEPGGLTRFRF